MLRRSFLVTPLLAAGPASSKVVLDAATGSLLYQSGPATSFHPGSTIKPLVSVPLIEARATAPVVCSGNLTIGARHLACSHPRPGGPVDLPLAVAWSCNEYFATAARRIRADALCDALRRLGLNPQTPQSPEQQSLLGVGEWGVQCSLADLARAYRMLAARKLAPVLEGMRGAVEYGTARLASPRNGTIAGKTGTSPNRARTGTNALFAGWAPADSPKIIVAVITPGGHGGADAAPLARELFEKFG